MRENDLGVPSGRDAPSDERSIVAALLDVLEEVCPFVFDDTLESVQSDGGPFLNRCDLGRMCRAAIDKAKAHIEATGGQVRSAEREVVIPIPDRLRVERLLKALGFDKGIGHEQIGWRGTLDEKGHLTPFDGEIFHCEFCYQGHADCGQINHSPDCPVTIARALSIQPEVED